MKPTASHLLADDVLTNLRSTFREAVEDPGTTKDDRLQLMIVYANGAAAIIGALPKTEAASAEDAGDEEGSLLARESGWLLIEAQSLLLEVDSDRAKAWLERFKEAMLPMLRKYTGDEEGKEPCTSP